MRDHNTPPLNPVPPIVWVLVLPMIAMEAAFGLGQAGTVGGPQAIGWRIEAIQRWSFVPDLWREMVSLGEFPLIHMARFVTYSFVHGNLTHAVFAVVILLALGKFVGDILRWWMVPTVFFGAAIFGALIYGLVGEARVPLIGAYPGDYGLIGAFTYLMWLRLAGTGAQQYRAFSLIGMLMAMQLLFGLLFGGAIDWVADLSGFAAGFVLTMLLIPGGIARLQDWFRQR